MYTGDVLVESDSPVKGDRTNPSTLNQDYTKSPSESPAVLTDIPVCLRLNKKCFFLYVSLDEEKNGYVARDPGGGGGGVLMLVQCAKEFIQ